MWRFASGPAKRWLVGLVTLALVVHPASAWCQAPRHNIGWTDVGLLASGVVALMALDERVSHDARRTDEGVRRSLAPFREFGSVPVAAAVGTSVFLGGVIFGNDDLTRSGRRLLATAAIAGAVVQVSKYTLGRERPNANEGAWDFDPFGGATSLYSGHSTMAFAMATALSHEIHRPAVTLGLYSVATLTAVSRVADDRHWLSDVAVGAVIGIAAAKFVYGDWTFLGIQAPRVLTGKSGAEVEWSWSF